MSNDVYGWDAPPIPASEFDEDGGGYVLLPPGVYRYECVKFERKKYGGSEKLDPCPEAQITIRIDAPEGTVRLKHRLFLHRKCLPLIAGFFVSCGLRKHGDDLAWPWDDVVGSSGYVSVKHRNAVKKDRATGEVAKDANGKSIVLTYNDLDRFLDPDKVDGAMPTAPTKPAAHPQNPDAEDADDDEDIPF